MWKNGPLPPETWMWGGITVVGENLNSGFYFADFHGDHAVIVPGGKIVKASEVAMYDNCLELPPAYSGTRKND